MSHGFAAIPAFMVAIVLSIAVALATLRLIGMMFAQEISVPVGICAIFSLIGLTAVSIASKSNVVAGAFLLSLVTLMVLYPFARDQLERIELNALDIEAVDRAHRAMSERPNNFAAHFELARGIHRFGLHGHAIAIAENVLRTLSDQRDDVKNMSLRDAFRTEDSMVKQWKREADPASFRPVKCPLCGVINQPGAVACTGCGKPYLLELVRAVDLRPRFAGKLVACFALVAGLIMLACYGGTELKGPMKNVVLYGGFALVGILLWGLFREKKVVAGIRGRQTQVDW